MISIAIDGPSGSGKGALAEGLAKKLNLIHLDTGAIFRGIAVGFIQANLLSPTEEEINSNIDDINIKIEFNNGIQQILLNNKNITHLLRAEEVSKMSSKISANFLVRQKYLKIVKEFSTNYNCVIDGRDISSEVLPNADLKIFLTASELIRAKRRYEENISKNIDCTLEEVAKNLQERDYRDTHRAISPLKIVPDAIVVDNSNLSIDETIEYCIQLAKTKIKKEQEW